MLTKGWSGTDAGTVTVTVRIATSRAPVFHLAQGPELGIPPSTRPYLAADDAFDTRDPNYEWNRWWSQAFVVLGPGTTSLSVPLDPAQWSQVSGQLGTSSAAATAGFWNAVNRGGRLGVVFGGGRSFGHGIWVDGGRATFTLVEYSVR